MDREILFRGFCQNEDGKEIIVVNGKAYNGNWVYGGTYIQKYKNKQSKSCILESYEAEDTDCDIEVYDVIPETVGQFIGLTDKNGKRIFEHDRIKYKCGDIAEVIFTEYGAFVGKTESLFYETIGGVLTEVIGTIFDKEEV